MTCQLYAFILQKMERENNAALKYLIAFKYVLEVAN